MKWTHTLALCAALALAGTVALAVPTFPAKDIKLAPVDMAGFAGASGAHIINVNGTPLWRYADSTTVSMVGGGGGGGETLTQTYAAGSSQTSSTIGLDSTRLGVRIRDNGTPISGDLLAVQNSTGSTTYLGVSTTRVSSAVPFSPSGDDSVNLGESSRRYATGYIKTLSAGASTLTLQGASGAGQVTLTGSALTSSETVHAPAFAGTGSAPTCTAGAAAGTGGSVGCAMTGAHNTNSSMGLKVTSGASGATTGVAAIVTFAGGGFTTAPNCVLGGGRGAAQAAVGWSCAIKQSTALATAVEIECGSTLATGQEYEFYLVCVE